MKLLRKIILYLFGSEIQFEWLSDMDKEMEDAYSNGIKCSYKGMKHKICFDHFENIDSIIKKLEYLKGLSK